MITNFAIFVIIFCSIQLSATELLCQTNETNYKPNLANCSPPEKLSEGQACTCPVSNGSDAFGKIVSLEPSSLQLVFRTLPGDQDEGAYKQFIIIAQSFGMDVKVKDTTYDTSVVVDLKRGKSLVPWLQRYRGCQAFDATCETYLKQLNPNMTTSKIAQLKARNYNGTLRIAARADKHLITLSHGPFLLRSQKNEITPRHFVTTIRISGQLEDLFKKYSGQFSLNVESMRRDGMLRTSSDQWVDVGSSDLTKIDVETSLQGR